MNELQSLMQEYQSLIAGEHHKERDCWVEIKQSFCGYKDEPEWYSIHDGYIYEWTLGPYKTYEEAFAAAIEQVKEMIQDELEIKNSGVVIL